MEKFKKADINNLKGLNVILVSGEGCANCYSMVPVLNEVSTRFKDVKFYNLEVDEEFKDFLDSYGVRTIPTILIIKDNSLQGSCHGYQPEEILELWLESKING